MSEPTLLYERHGSTCVLTINRPEVHNAIDQSVWDGLADGLERAEADPRVRVIILTGAGDSAFCAGADLKAIAEHRFRGDNPPDERRKAWGFAGVVGHEISTPLIAAVNGRALGGGWEIVLACDLVVAVESALFALPEVARGLVAGGGGAFRIAEMLPRPLAMEILLTADPISAARAHDMGLVNTVCPDGRALSTAMELAERVTRNAPLAVQATKRIARGIVDGVVDRDAAKWLLSADEVQRVLKSDDAREGPAAFLAKRPPRWLGR